MSLIPYLLLSSTLLFPKSTQSFLHLPNLQPKSISHVPPYSIHRHPSQPTPQNIQFAPCRYQKRTTQLKSNAEPTPDDKENDGDYFNNESLYEQDARELDEYDDDDDENELLPEEFLSVMDLSRATEWDEGIAGINSITLTGRVGNDPLPKYFDDGKCVLNLSLAVKRKYHPLERKVRNIKYGEEETDWYSLEMWGRDAEFAGKFVNKGARVGVIGGLQIDTWVDKATGAERERPKIIVRQFEILETKAEAELREKNRGNYQGRRDSGGGGGGYYNWGQDDDEGGYGSGGSSEKDGFFD